MPKTDSTSTTSSRIDPFLLAVLSSRFEAIMREMTNTIIKASRSAIIKNGRDFSVGLLTFDHRLISVEDGLPIHITALELSTGSISRCFDDVEEGNAFFNNCPYMGATHHADLDVVVPIYCDGKPMFWALARCHHADMGAPLPTTYLPYAATIYEEGLHFPCVRVQENFEDKKDVVRMATMKIRASNLWYGDYRAQVGACRVAERRLKELVSKYGHDTIETFIEEWMDYGKRRATAAIKELPGGVYTYETKHDPVPGVADEGVPVKVTVTVDSDEGMITVDARENMDCVAGGINLSEATATGSCRIGVFVNLDPTIPHNAGSASRINVLLRDGCVVGKPKYPVGTSVATTNVNDRLINAVQCSFSNMGKPHGIAEGGAMQAAGIAVVSGIDSTRENRQYINQVFIGYSGGPGLNGYDGWLTYNDADTSGMLKLDSIEIDESMYPFLVEERRTAIDSLGSGQWDGAPATWGVYRPTHDDMSVIYCSDGDQTPARGVLGGNDAACSVNMKRHLDGQWKELPSFHQEICSPKEAIGFRSGGGGGYGDPKIRDPERVAASVNRGWLSREYAEKVYDVELCSASNGYEVIVDAKRTETARARAKSD